MVNDNDQKKYDKLKKEIIELEEWLANNSIQHPEFMNHYKRKDELKIRKKALYDRMSGKGKSDILITNYQFHLPTKK